MSEMMRGRMLPGLAVAGLALAFMPAASAGLRGLVSAIKAGSCASGWVIQQQAGPGTLGSVAAASPRQAWAVGSRPDAAGFPVTLAERWNGTGWAAVPTPNPPAPLPPSPADVLLAVTAVSASDAWAVGGAGEMSGQLAGGLAEHWNGSRWLAVSIPRLSAGGQLEGVAAVSAGEVWAVGAGGVSSAGGDEVAYALRWDGVRWSSVPVPQPGAFHGLAAVTRIPGTGTLWAVGFQEARPGAPLHPVIDYWNGARWSVVSAPAVAGGSLYGVTALGPDDAWAVGGIVGKVPRPLILHWNGTRWSQVAATAGGPLSGVTALAPDQAWAVGGSTILTWNGTTWQSVPWPHPAGAALSGITAVQGAGGWTAWAAGGAGSAKSLVITRCSLPAVRPVSAVQTRPSRVRSQSMEAGRSSRRVCGQPSPIANPSRTKASLRALEYGGRRSSAPSARVLLHPRVANDGRVGTPAAPSSGRHGLSAATVTCAPLESDASIAAAPSPVGLGGQGWGGREVIAEERAWRAAQAKSRPRPPG